ncbi:MAG TPA: acetylxylan esterase, partial [Methylomirabilota bacterium]|nr:acetylxylan esterase [Methylomirabilota bacterium]
MHRTVGIFPVLFARLLMCVAGAQSPAPVAFTAEQDHQNMMEQLGIKALRPGPSGDEKATNHANYDEAKANPFAETPDPLTTNDGRKVTSAKMWWEVRRPEIVEMFEKNVYGRVPAGVPKVTWTVTAVDHEMIGFTPVIAKDLIGTVDNSGYPAITVKMHMTLVTPANAKAPVPVLMMFGRAGFPAPNEPSAEEFERINKAWKAMLVAQDPSLKEVFEKHPAWEPVKATPFQFPQ